MALRVHANDQGPVSRFHQGPRHKPHTKSGSMAAILTFSPSLSDRLTNGGRPSMGTGLRFFRCPERLQATEKELSRVRMRWPAVNYQKDAYCEGTGRRRRGKVIMLGMIFVATVSACCRPSSGKTAGT